VAAQTSSSAGNADAASRAFRCPESFPTQTEKEASLHNFMSEYQSTHSQKTVRELLDARYSFLVEHDCHETLAFMAAHVSPVDEKVRFDNRDFVRDSPEFNPETQVMTVYFDAASPSNQEPTEELILNLYGWNPVHSPTDVAAAFVSPRPNLQILNKFAAPDAESKDLSYYVVSIHVIPNKLYGYLNLTRIGPIAGSAFAVTYALKLSANSADELSAKAKAWLLSDRGHAAEREIAQIGADSSWQTALAEKQPHEELSK
jgi:hypothetical protein